MATFLKSLSLLVLSSFSIGKYITISAQASLHAKLTTSIQKRAVSYSTEGYSAAQRLGHQGFDFNAQQTLASLSLTFMGSGSGTAVMLMLFLILSHRIKIKHFSSEVSGSLSELFSVWSQ